NDHVIGVSPVGQQIAIPVGLANGYRLEIHDLAQRDRKPIVFSAARTAGAPSQPLMMCSAFSPDGTQFAWQAAPRMVRLVNLATQQEKWAKVLEGSEPPISR